MKKLFLSITLLLTAFCVFSQYYISPAGNDANNGSQAAPWKTLSKATSAVSIGVINVLPGTYNETQTSNLRPGVSIRGEGSATTVINVSITSQWGSFISLSSPQNTNGAQEISGLTLNGKYASESSKGTWVAIWVTGRSNVLIHDTKITNFYASAAIFDGFDATSPSKDPGVTATGNKFYNNDVSNCSGVVDQQYGNGAVMIGGQTGMDISNNSIVCTGRPNFLNGWPIKYYDNGYLKGCRINGNILVKAPYMAGYWGQGGDWDFAIELFNIQGLEIAGNTIQGAIDLNYNYKGSYPYSVWIHDNTLNHATPNYTHPESGIIFEFATQSAIVENNVFNNKFVGISYNLRTPGNTGGYTYGCPTGGCSEVTNNIIRNNLFTNLYQAPYGASGGIITQTEGGTNDVYITNMQVYNNTFVAKASGAAPTGLDFTSQNNGTVTGVSIYNNIFQSFPGGSVTGQKAKTQSGISITNNDYYQCAAPVWSGATISGNLNLNPQFDPSYRSQNAALNGIGWTGGSAPPPPGCTAYTYSAWGTCISGQQTRTVISASPVGCSGGVAPVLTQSCTVEPVPCSYTYSAWGSCDPNTNTQSRTVISVSPAGCIQNSPPVLVQSCIPPVPGDTIRCQVIFYLPATGTGYPFKRNLTYIVKRADGFWYDSTGTKVDAIKYKDGSKWYDL